MMARTTFIYETLGANGIETIHKSYARRVENGNYYKIFSTSGVSWLPHDSSTTEGTHRVSLHATIVEGVKGEVDGDYRADTVRLTTISGDGTVLQNPPTTVRVLLKSPTPEEMSFQEVMDWVRENTAAGAACALPTSKEQEER